MKKLLALFSIALLASCAGPTTQPPPARTFEPSYNRPQIGTTAEKVDRSTTNVRREADALRGQVSNLKIVASEATNAAKSAREELDRLVGQKTATESELSDLSKLFKNLEQRNMFLESTVDQTELDVQQLNETIEELETSVDEMTLAATRKDEEVAELRQLLKSANDHNDAIQKANEKLSKAAAKAEIDRASAKTWKYLGITAIVLVFLLILFWVAIRTGLLTLTGR